MLKHIYITFSFLIIISMALADMPAAKSAFAQEQNGQGVKQAIVKIFTVASKPNYYSPWLIGTPRSSSGSGVIISGNRILTNAHVVSNQTFIQAKLYGNAKRYNARVVSVSHEADLALLTVDDPEFFAGRTPLEFGTLPQVMQEALVYGYPIGGSALSITKGIISRIEYQEYAHSNFYFLAGQLDAAINPGNSGGPVIMDNKIVGIAMQGFSAATADNIGYMIPTPIINHFLTDIMDGNYDGFPELGFMTQTMESPAMKKKYNMSESQTGILVKHVFFNAMVKGKVKPGDVLMAIDGHKIADNGTVEFRPGERTLFGYYSDLHQVGEEMNLTLLRKGKVKQVKFTMGQTNEEFALVEMRKFDVRPSYFIFGGIVFSPLTKNLLCEWKNCAGPNRLITETTNWPTKDKLEVAVAIQVLPADVNLGYHRLRAWVVEEVNGKKFKDFSEFHKLVTTSKSKYIVLKNDKASSIVIDRKEALDTHENILRTYNIKEDRSTDLK